MNDEQLELWKNLSGSNTLHEVQGYIRKVIEIRGFSNQSIEQAMLLLTVTENRFRPRALARKFLQNLKAIYCRRL